MTESRLRRALKTSAAPRFIAARSTFLASLSVDSLLKARIIVKRTHMKHYPTELMTDREADRIIEAMGPTAMEDAMKFIVDRAGFR
jgi:hypothetical protein